VTKCATPLALVIAVALVACGGDEGDSAAETVAADTISVSLPDPGDEPGGYDSTARGLFAFARRPQAPEDRPSGYVRQQAGSAPPELGVDVSNARRVTASSGHRAYAMPGVGAVCVFSEEGGSGGCTPTSRLMETGGWGVQGCAGFNGRSALRIDGLVPDGVEHVEIQTRGGTTRRIAVRENYVSARFRKSTAAALPAAVGFKQPDGKAVRHALPVPSNMHKDDC
jgi:hypothetical protein